MPKDEKIIAVDQAIIRLRTTGIHESLISRLENAKSRYMRACDNESLGKNVKLLVRLNGELRTILEIEIARFLVDKYLAMARAVKIGNLN